MNRFGAGSVIRMGAVLPLVVAVMLSLGAADAAQVAPGSAAPRAADAGPSQQVAAPAQTATGQAADKPDATGAATPEQAQTLQGVAVTGTRIPQPSLTGSAALQAISANEIQLQGTVNVDQLLSNVPSAATLSSSNTDSENSASTVGLRGFGANRTLVLINGTRLVPGDPAAFNTAATDINGANLNFIPTALVERVEVLTGGASAIYGSDAIAGVVNFIMKQDFEGFSFDAQGTQSDHGDGTTYSPTMIWGANSADGKGNVTLYAGYTQQSGVSLQARDYSRCPWLPNESGTARECFGASSIQEGNFTSLDRPFGDNNVMVDPNGTRTFVPYDGRVLNFDEDAYLVRPDRRYNFGGFAHHKINDHFEVYGSAMYMQDKNRSLSSPPQLNFSQVDINCSNPLLSGQQRDYLCPNPGQIQASTLIGRAFKEMGPRTIESENREYRIQLGVRGAISDGWKYDVSAQRSENTTTLEYLNYSSLRRARQALQVTTDGNGNPVCIDPADGCVPLDLFQNLAVSPAAANFIRSDGLEHATTIEQVATASVTGDLGRYNLRSPFA
ncbi:MAG TPA: TonB-dependent receptor plug domain-containing protein, partial [Rhodanobacter sp.]|nr:TonB-dependent receptor plug domain-containing protein [Rhodanobacter sp.]